MFTGIIYCYESPSGRCYIGKTLHERKRKQRHLFDAIKGSNIPFHRAIRKYGLDSFNYSILFTIRGISSSRIDTVLCSLERFFIKKFLKSNHPLYNISSGGEGGGNMKGKQFTEESKLKMRNSHLGIRQSKETREKRSKSMKGKRNLSKDEINKLAEGRRKNLKAVIQYDLHGNFIRRWDNTPSIPSTIASYFALKACLNGYNKTCGGYIWKYERINQT